MLSEIFWKEYVIKDGFIQIREFFFQLVHISIVHLISKNINVIFCVKYVCANTKTKTVYFLVLEPEEFEEAYWEPRGKIE